MSHPKHYWYGIARQMIANSDNLESERTLQATIFMRAIEDATEETLRLPNGKERMKAVRAVIINKTKTIDGCANEMYYSPSTIKKWLNSYVNLVGKKAGF